MSAASPPERQLLGRANGFPGLSGHLRRAGARNGAALHARSLHAWN